MGSFPLPCLMTGRVIVLTDWCSNSKKSKQRFSGSGCIPRSFEKWFQTQSSNMSRHIPGKKSNTNYLSILSASWRKVPGTLPPGLQTCPIWEKSSRVKHVCGRNCVKGSKRFKTQFLPRFTHPPHNDMPPLELFKHVCVLAFRYTWMNSFQNS